jgi:hypothetical protein
LHFTYIMHWAKCASHCGISHTIVCPLDNNYRGDMSQHHLLVYISRWRKVLNTRSSATEVFHIQRPSLLNSYPAATRLMQQPLHWLFGTFGMPITRSHCTLLQLLGRLQPMLTWSWIYFFFKILGLFIFQILFKSN